MTVPVETHVHRARDRVKAEQVAVDRKRSAFEVFGDRVADVPTGTLSTSSGVTATAGTQFQADGGTDDHCHTVLSAFAETVRPACVDDDSEPLLVTVRSELTDSIAVALAPTTETRFTADLKQSVIAAADRRRTETRVLRRALEREASALEDAVATVEEITEWLVDANETLLSGLGFEALQSRHETLSAHRNRCDQLARSRQAGLETTTSKNAETGIRHRTLVPQLYEDFPVDHPILATVARLDDTCRACQRTLREHLVRRV